MGFTLTIILSGLLHRLLFRYGLEGLVILRIEPECCFCLDPWLETDIKGVVIPALVPGKTYLQTQSGLEEHAPVKIGYVSTLACSDNIGTIHCNGSMGVLLF
jgi:hypothetical protein